MTNTEKKIIGGIAFFAIAATIFMYLIGGINAVALMWAAAAISSLILR